MMQDASEEKAESRAPTVVFILVAGSGPGSGKSTFAKALMDGKSERTLFVMGGADPTTTRTMVVRRAAFAARLKDLCCQLYDLTEAQVTTALKDVLLCRLDRAESPLLTPRDILKHVAAGHRAIDPDIWARQMHYDVMTAAKGYNFTKGPAIHVVVVDDWRYTNESVFLRDKGHMTFTIFVEREDETKPKPKHDRRRKDRRKPKDQQTAKVHESEAQAQLLKESSRYVVRNDAGLPELQKDATELWDVILAKIMEETAPDKEEPIIGLIPSLLEAP